MTSLLSASYRVLVLWWCEMVHGGRWVSLVKRRHRFHQLQHRYCPSVPGLNLKGGSIGESAPFSVSTSSHVCLQDLCILAYPLTAVHVCTL